MNLSTISTAGKILDENDLRSFSKCSEFYRRGGRDKLTFGQELVRASMEKLFIKSLKKELKDPASDLQSTILFSLKEINKNHNLLEPQIDKNMNLAILWLKDFFNIFPLSKYITILGPIEPVVKINKTPIKLHISGLFRSKERQTIHAITFSPYGNKHSILNDPSNILKIKMLQPFVQKHLQTNRSQVILHIFSFTKNGNLEYHSIDSNDVTTNKFETIKSLVKAIESDYRYPVIPCNHSCPFKKDCY